MAFARAMGSASPTTVPHKFQHIREALVEAAHTVYCQPVAYDRLPPMVRQQQDSLKTFLLSHPFWWTRLEHLHQVLTLWRAVHTAWCIATLESQLGLSRPHRHEQPSARSHRWVFGRQLGPSMEPKYVVSMSVNPRLRAHVTLDQLCQRHLAPVGSLSRDYVSNLMACPHGWGRRDISTFWTISLFLRIFPPCGGKPTQMRIFPQTTAPSPCILCHFCHGFHQLLARLRRVGVQHSAVGAQKYGFVTPHDPYLS